MLGEIYVQHGKRGKARENYRRHLDLWQDADPGLAVVGDAREKLAELKAN